MSQLLPSEPWTPTDNSYKHQLPCYFCTVIIIKAVYGRPSTFLYLCWLPALSITVVIKHILNKWFLFSIIFGKALSKHELVSTNYSNAFKFFNVSPRIHHYTDEQLLWMLYVCMYVCMCVCAYCISCVHWSVYVCMVYYNIISLLSVCILYHSIMLCVCVQRRERERGQ